MPCREFDLSSSCSPPYKKALLPERLRLFLIHDFKHLRRRYNKRFFREMLFVTSDQIRVFISLRHGDFIKHQILRINQLLSSNQSLHRNSVGDDCLKHGRNQCFRKMKLGPAQHLCIFAHDFLIIQRNDVSAEKALYKPEVAMRLRGESGVPIPKHWCRSLRSTP